MDLVCPVQPLAWAAEAVGTCAVAVVAAEKALDAAVADSQEVAAVVAAVALEALSLICPHFYLLTENNRKITQQGVEEMTRVTATPQTNVFGWMRKNNRAAHI